MKQNKIFFYIILLIFIILSIEFISFVFFSLYKEDYTFYKIKDYAHNNRITGNVINNFDAELGWDPKYNTEFGERKRAISYEEDSISTFGDSFTHCNEVEDDETWQHYLSQKLNKNVYNFGTGGFGTGQAYLRFKRDYPKVKTKIVTLGFISSNLDRIVNVYRPFYSPDTGIRLTKPSFTINHNKLEIIKNPIEKEEDLKKLQNKNFLQEIGEDDYWYNNQDLPIFAFPYTKIFFNKHFWNEWYNGKYDDLNTRRNRFWDDEEIVKIMFSIFDNFVNGAKGYNATPVIMILPHEPEVIDYWNGEKRIHINKTLEYCKSKNYLCFNTIEVFANSAKNEEEINSYFNGHVSAKGNKIIAQSFYEFLKENNLIE